MIKTLQDSLKLALQNVSTLQSELLSKSGKSSKALKLKDLEPESDSQQLRRKIDKLRQTESELRLEVKTLRAQN